jgi:heme/copper-type cytochrome/quinol oxidase subunit 4
MGVAVGLGLAFILTHISVLHIVAFIDLSNAPEDAMRTLMITFATTFGIGATVTGIVLMIMNHGD